MIYIVMFHEDVDFQPRAMLAFKSRNAATSHMVAERKLLQEQYKFLSESEVSESIYILECQLEE
jgi:hypothetical protein